MFGIGGTELIVIAIVLLIAVGPNRLPNLLKAVVKGYREFRRATRELRASTGIDEILQDEDLRDLRKPLYVPPPKGKTVPAKPAGKKRSLSFSERVQEDPPEGVDIAEIHDAEGGHDDAEGEAIRAAKIAAAKGRADDDSEDAERIRAAKIAAAATEAGDPEEAERVRAAKIAAASSPSAGSAED